MTSDLGILPCACPICGSVMVQPVLERFTMTVQTVREPTAAGLAAFCCLTYGHIFFVRHADLESRLVA
jgi:hypothetical protein